MRNHQLESRVRENRTHGSEGGESGKPDFPTPIEGCSLPIGRLAFVRLRERGARAVQVRS